MFFSHASGGKLEKKPGVDELLKYLKMRGFKIGLASSTRRHWCVRRFQMAGCWDILIRLSGEIWWNGVSRNRIFFWRLADDWGPRPENCYVIEDSHNGIRAAYAAGASDHGAGSDGGDGGDEVPRRRDSGIALRSAGIFAGVRHINSFVFMSVSVE